MSPMPVIDPAVEEILRDVARDPRSSLLRVERPRVRRELRETRPRVGLGATGLRAAERELLRAHRAEVAWLLKEMCKERLANEERSKLFLSRYIDAEHQVEILPPDELRLRASELPRADLPPIETPWEDLDVRTLLERATAGPAEGRPSISQLALASLRLEPDDSTRICLGLDLAFSRRTSAARSTLSSTVHSTSGNSLRAAIYTNTGLAFAIDGDHELALQANAAAIAVSPDSVCPDVAFNILYFALQAGAEKAAGRAIDLISDVCVQRDKARIARSILARQAMGMWRPTKACESLARMLIAREDLTPEVRLVLQAMV